MDHSCYKCGHSVEDGKPFCGQCGAPQIRVPMPEAAVVATGGNSSRDLPVFASDSPFVPGAASVSRFSTEIVWPRAFRACAVAALIAILITALRLAVPLLAILSTGCLAVIFYRMRNPTWRVSARGGAQLGAIAGVLFSAISAIVAFLVVIVLQAGGEARQQMLEAFQQAASASKDPQMQSALEFFKAPEGLAVKVVAGVALVAVLSIGIGSLAGAMTGALLGRRNKP
ncbi:MAG: zinc ribbon domain-containing protein [Candidatus Sulfotelmatobacter sp.]